MRLFANLSRYAAPSLIALAALASAWSAASAQTATPTATATPTPTPTPTPTATPTVTPTATATPIAAGISGTVPASGGMGLLVALGANTASSLVATLASAGCTVETLGVIQAGTWYIYVSGAPAAVNALFPASMTDRQGFFVRCR